MLWLAYSPRWASSTASTFGSENMKLKHTKNGNIQITMTPAQAEHINMQLFIGKMDRNIDEHRRDTCAEFEQLVDAENLDE